MGKIEALSPSLPFLLYLEGAAAPPQLWTAQPAGMELAQDRPLGRAQ